MRLRVAALIPIALAAAAIPAVAQDGPAARPGGVVTVITPVDPRRGADSVRFELEPSTGVRAFGPTTGTVRAGADPLRLPFTFGLPADAPAGSFMLARLRLQWPDGSADEPRELRAEVAARRDIAFSVAADTAAASPGRPLAIGWRLANRGNAADSFSVTLSAPADWRRSAAPLVVWLAPGDTAAGVAQLEPPADAPPGIQHVVRIEAAGEGIRRSVGVTVVVTSPEPWLGDLAHVPGSVFVGSTSDASAPAVALTAAGELRPGTRVELALRHTGRPTAGPPAFRGELGGPRLRLGITGAAWRVRLGDVFAPGDLFLGTLGQGRGVEAGLSRAGWEGALLAARPTSFTGLEEGGHVVRAEGARRTPYGRVGLTAASVRVVAGPWEPQHTLGGGLTYAGAADGHEIAAEAGWMTVRADSAARAGFAARARYDFRWEGGRVHARLRKTPGATPRTASQGDEAFVSGSVDIRPGLGATGWAYISSAPLVSGGAYPVSDGAAAGLVVGLPRGADARLVASYRSSRSAGSDLPASVTRSARASLDLPLRVVTLETDLELGTASGPRTGGFSVARAGVRWSAGEEWGWVGLSRHAHGAGPARTSADLSGALRVRTARVQGGASLRLDGGAAPEALAFWSGLVVPVGRQLDVSSGLEYRTTGAGDPWRVSLGVTRRFGLPLPIRRSPALHGVAFEDLDGDRRLDPDEPRLGDVPLQLGPLRARTDARGRFRFDDAGFGTLRLDAARAAPGLVVPADVHLPDAGWVEIPLIRTAALRLEIFLDRDGNGRQDTFDPPAAGALISLTDRRGRTLDAAADSAGVLRFDRLEPGDYTLRVYPSPGRGARVFELPLTLAPGSALERAVAVPLRQREIRMQSGR